MITFKSIVLEYFGTMQALGETLGVHRITAATFFHHPDRLSVKQIKAVSDKCGMDVGTVFTSIINQVQ